MILMIPDHKVNLNFRLSVSFKKEKKEDVMFQLDSNDGLCMSKLFFADIDFVL